MSRVKWFKKGRWYHTKQNMEHTIAPPIYFFIHWHSEKANLILVVNRWKLLVCFLLYNAGNVVLYFITMFFSPWEVLLSSSRGVRSQETFKYEKQWFNSKADSNLKLWKHDGTSKYYFQILLSDAIIYSGLSCSFLSLLQHQSGTREESIEQLTHWSQDPAC